MSRGMQLALSKLAGLSASRITQRQQARGAQSPTAPVYFGERPRLLQNRRGNLIKVREYEGRRAKRRGGCVRRELNDEIATGGGGPDRPQRPRRRAARTTRAPARRGSC